MNILLQVNNLNLAFSGVLLCANQIKHGKFKITVLFRYPFFTINAGFLLTKFISGVIILMYSVSASLI